MTSNCYLVYNDDTQRCLVIDPGSEKSEREISFIIDNKLHLDYIIISHEHTDHNWGVNALHKKYPTAQIICSEKCKKGLQRANDMYFLFYYDNPNYRYVIDNPDVIIKEDNHIMDWDSSKLHFVLSPGHSNGSMCISINDMLFTGDTMMPYKAYFNGRDSDKLKWKESINSIRKMYQSNMVIYPGHGEIICLEEWIKHYFK